MSLECLKLRKVKKEEKVVVVHTKERITKNKDNGKKVIKANTGDWTKLIASFQKMGANYIVGDTNMTNDKANLGKGKGDYVSFWKEAGGDMVDKITVPSVAIEKKRKGDSKNGEVNGFLNNQIHKGGGSKN